MNFDTRIPIYLQIIELIKKDIVMGNVIRGDKLPSVRVMANDLKVNVNTVQRVYQELEREGITFTERGKGSFITEDDQIVDKLKDSMASELLKNFVDGMKELGYTNENIFDHLSNYIKED